MNCVLTASVKHNNSSFAFIQLSKRSHPLQIICITNCCIHSVSSLQIVWIAADAAVHIMLPVQYMTVNLVILSYCHSGNIQDSKIKSLWYQEDWYFSWIFLIFCRHYLPLSIFFNTCVWVRPLFSFFFLYKSVVFCISCKYAWTCCGHESRNMSLVWTKRCAYRFWASFFVKQCQ